MNRDGRNSLLMFHFTSSNFLDGENSDTPFSNVSNANSVLTRAFYINEECLH